jgi:hypothetical protein
VTPSDKKKSSGRGNHAHHIDDGFEICSLPLPLLQLKQLRRDEEEAYHMAVAHDPRAPQAKMEEIEYDEEESACHKEYFDSRCPRSGWKSLFKKNKFSASEPC